MTTNLNSKYAQELFNKYKVEDERAIGFFMGLVLIGKKEYMVNYLEAVASWRLTEYWKWL